MTESKIMKSFLPEMRGEEAGKPESATRLPEGPVVVNPFGTTAERDFFYYKDYQSYLDDIPYIDQFIEMYRPDLTDNDVYYSAPYDDQDPRHRKIKENSHLLITQLFGQQLMLNDVVSSFKEVMTAKDRPGQVIIPMHFLEYMPQLGRASRRALQRDVKQILKEKHQNKISNE